MLKYKILNQSLIFFSLPQHLSCCIFLNTTFLPSFYTVKLLAHIFNQSGNSVDTDQMALSEAN